MSGTRPRRRRPCILLPQPTATAAVLVGMLGRDHGVALTQRQDRTDDTLAHDPPATAALRSAMARVRLSAVGAARPDTVWQRYADLDQWASWSPQIRTVHCADRRLRPGMSGTVESVAGIRAAFVVEAVDHDRRSWTWRVRLGRIRIRLHHEVRPHGRGSATTLTMEGPRPALFAYAPLARLALRRLVRP